MDKLHSSQPTPALPEHTARIKTSEHELNVGKLLLLVFPITVNFVLYLLSYAFPGSFNISMVLSLSLYPCILSYLDENDTDVVEFWIFLALSLLLLEAIISVSVRNVQHFPPSTLVRVVFTVLIAIYAIIAIRLIGTYGETASIEATRIKAKT